MLFALQHPWRGRPEGRQSMLLFTPFPKTQEAHGELVPNIDTLKTMTRSSKLSMCSEIVQVICLLWMKRGNVHFACLKLYRIEIWWHSQRKMRELVHITLPVIDGNFSSYPQHNDLVYRCLSWLIWMSFRTSLVLAATWWQRLSSLEASLLPSLTHELESAFSLCMWPLDEELDLLLAWWPWHGQTSF